MAQTFVVAFPPQHNYLCHHDSVIRVSVETAVKVAASLPSAASRMQFCRPVAPSHIILVDQKHL